MPQLPNLPETHRLERGHNFYPSAIELADVPKLYAADKGRLADKTIWLHYFVGDCDWWVIELDPSEGLAFGYVCLHGDASSAEWGYISLVELEALYKPGGVQRDSEGRVRLVPQLIVERDLHWRPRPVREAGLPGSRAM